MDSKNRMNQFVYLSSCDTCKRILKEVNLPKKIILRDIKKTPLKPNELKSFKNITANKNKGVKIKINNNFFIVLVLNLTTS